MENDVTTKDEVWSALNYEEKNHQLFLKQKALLDQFLNKGAISQAQHDKSLHDLILLMKDGMMARDVEQYIEEHAFCAELIFRDWEEFLNVLYANGRRVSAILWWDYCLVEKQGESLGGGGYKDPKNPGYMYAETEFYENGFETFAEAEILDYVRSMRAKYPDNELVPGFYLANE